MLIISSLVKIFLILDKLHMLRLLPASPCIVSVDGFVLELIFAFRLISVSRPFECHGFDKTD
jgi:hypothetical protein